MTLTRRRLRVDSVRKMTQTSRPRRTEGLVAAIVGITVVPLALLVWIGWRLIDQDRALERQQLQQRVDRALDLGLAALQRVIAASEERLRAGADQWPGGGGAFGMAARHDRPTRLRRGVAHPGSIRAQLQGRANRRGGARL